VPASLRELARGEAQAIRRAILSRGVRDGHLVKWLEGNDVDASLVACSTPFELLAPDDPITASTVGLIEARLAHGGVHRYIADTYYGGGEWILLAALLGWHYQRAGSSSRARAQLDWVVGQADEHGNLPEQVSHHLLAPDRYQEWLEMWGPIARPLLWSHAMFLTLAVELGAVSLPLVVASG
jgi:GH15 family glucan-1,4-alpha-glucosidase